MCGHSLFRFPKEERTLATAISAAANGLGNCVAFLLGPAVAVSAQKVPTLLYSTTILAALPFFATLAFLPKAQLASRDENDERAGQRDSSCTLFFSLFRKELLQWNFMLIVFVSGASSGVNSALNGMLQDVLGPTLGNTGGNGTVNPSAFLQVQETVGEIGFASGLLSMLASVAIAALVDHFLSPRLYATFGSEGHDRSWVNATRNGHSESDSSRVDLLHPVDPLTDGNAGSMPSIAKEDGTNEVEVVHANLVKCTGFKALVVVQLGLTLLSLFGLYLVVTSVRSTSPMMPSMFAGLLPPLSRQERLLAVWTLLCASAAFQAGVSPMLYELAAECTFPLDPSVSLSVIVLVYNLFTLIVLSITPALQGEAQSIIPVTVATMAVCFCVSTMVETDFKRACAERQRQAGTAEDIGGEQKPLLSEGEDV